MRLPLFIAWRYLFAKKSQQVINIVSWVSAVGIALGTMALVVILSVYNGFDSLVRDLYRVVDADLVVRPVEGKTFVPPQTALFADTACVAAVCPVVEDNVFLQYRGQQTIATVKGVDSVFLRHTRLTGAVTQGYFNVWFGEVEEAVLGRGLAQTLGVNVNFTDPLYIYYPKNQARFSAINPMASLQRVKVFPAGVFSVEPNFDAAYTFIPIEAARRVLGYEDEVSYLELKLAPRANSRRVQKALQAALGDDFKVLNRYQQNETLYRMMTIEKIIIYLILLFVLLIICCNLLGSLALLIIEKEADMEILISLGATGKTIRRVFALEGWLISVFGMVVGLVLGLVLCVLQQKIGIVSMPGNFSVKYYPVIIRLPDMALIMVTVLSLGGLAAWLPAQKVKQQAQYEKSTL